MAEAHAVIVIEPIRRSASWWRAAGFPVPFGVPDDALGTLNANKIVFTWDLT